MHLYAKNMHKICTYIDSISQICKRYAPNMLENIHKYASDVQLICKKYAKKICKYIDYISQICKKYAGKICRNKKIDIQNMQKYIYCVFCIYMHSPLC